MNAIIGLYKGPVKDRSDRQAEGVSDSYKTLAGDALIVLINDILDLAKVDYRQNGL